MPNTYIVPGFQSWYDNLNESQKQRYRRKFDGSEDAGTSGVSQLSVRPGASSVHLSDRTKPSVQGFSDTTTAAQHSMARDTNASSLADKSAEMGQAQSSIASVHDKSSPMPEKLQSLVAKASLPATLDRQHAIDNKVKDLIVVRNGRFPAPMVPQAQVTANEAAVGMATETSVYTGRRFSSTGTKVPLSLKRGSMGGAENPILKKASMSTDPTSSTRTSTTQITVPEAFALPSWLREVQITPRTAYSQRDCKDLMAIRDRMDKHAASGATEESRKAQSDLIRADLHKYEHMLVDEVLIKKSKLLEYGVGLPQLFRTGVGSIIYPYDIAADAEALYNKWRRHDFDPDIMRGIENRRKKGKNEKTRFVRSLIPDYPYRISGNEFGENDLVNGQWWPILLAALRDGAHGVPQGGIHGAAGKGAYSILVSGASGSSGAHYDDKDEGDTLYYCGTEGGDGGELTDATKRLHENITTHLPVRVLRTAKLPAENPFRPSFGYRYDGLYDVLDYEILDPRKGHHRFRLKRREHQGPIRCKGVHARPSQEDVEAFRKLAGNERFID